MPDSSLSQFTSDNNAGAEFLPTVILLSSENAHCLSVILIAVALRRNDPNAAYSTMYSLDREHLTWVRKLSKKAACV
jgi:hypothetical protein